MTFCFALPDCGSEDDNGIQSIDPDGQGAFQILCEAGFVVIQRRQDGSEDFFRTWADYKKGFGNLTGEFWLGNDYIHRLTKAGFTSLRIDMENQAGEQRYAQYVFTVDDESNSYRATATAYTGTAGNSFLKLGTWFLFLQKMHRMYVTA